MAQPAAVLRSVVRFLFRPERRRLRRQSGAQDYQDQQQPPDGVPLV